MEFTYESCSDLIAKAVEKQSSPDEIEKIAKEAQFKNNPLFGAMKKRIQLMAEVSVVNTAIAIFAANCSFKQEDLKPIIDGSLQLLQKYMFSIIEKNLNGFKDLYAKRMAEYYPILQEEQPGIGLSFVFLKNLHGKPKLDFEGQTKLAVRFTSNISSSVEAMQTIAKYL